MIEIREFTKADKDAWDAYVYSHPNANLYQLSGWNNVISKTYGHNCYYLVAVETPAQSKSTNPSGKVDEIVGEDEKLTCLDERVINRLTIDDDISNMEDVIDGL